MLSPPGEGGGGPLATRWRQKKNVLMLPLELVSICMRFACFAQLASHLDWLEPIGLQETSKGRSSHNGEFSVMFRESSRGNCTMHFQFIQMRTACLSSSALHGLKCQSDKKIKCNTASMRHKSSPRLQSKERIL